MSKIENRAQLRVTINARTGLIRKVEILRLELSLIEGIIADLTSQIDEYNREEADFEQRTKS